jgi:hypothetical protein
MLRRALQPLSPNLVSALDRVLDSREVVVRFLDRARNHSLRSCIQNYTATHAASNVTGKDSACLWNKVVGARS